MFKNMMSSIKNVWSVVLPPLPQPTLMTGTAQTMLSWPKVIESPDEVPDAFRSFFRTWLKDVPEFPYTVLSPAKQGFFAKSADKLICDMGDTLYMVEQFGDRIIAHGYRPENVHDIEVGIVLLHGWIAVKGITNEGVPASSLFLFNSSRGDVVSSFVDKIRSAPAEPDGAMLDEERSKFDYLSQVDYKFMNYARSSLKGGERVIHSVWQPEIFTTVGGVLGLSLTRSLSPTHMLILTDKEVILIQDEARSRGNKGVRYGGIRRYMPLHAVQAVSLAEQPDDGLMTLSVHLSEDDSVDVLFSASKEKDLLQFKAGIEGLSSSPT